MKKLLSGLLVFIFMLNLAAVPVSAGELPEEASQEECGIPEELLERMESMEGLPELLEERPDGVRAYADDKFQCEPEEWDLLYLTNLFRMSENVKPLSMMMNLQNAADIRANELPQLFEDTRPNGSSYSTVLDEQGIRRNYDSESIARNRPDAWKAWSSWMENTSDRERMRIKEYSHIGIGYNEASEGGPYWVQLYVGDCTPTSISILQDSESRYIMYQGRKIDEIGLALRIECEHGTSYMPVTEEMCSGYDLSRLNEEQTVTVNYGGLTASFKILVREPLPFWDVPKDSWFYNYAAEVYYNGIMTGLTSDTFGPSEELSRAQFATILWRMTNEPGMSYEPVFPDVADGQFYTTAALWAYAADVISGYDDGNFGPADPITREQMATMMYRYANAAGIDTSKRADLGGFPDCGNVSDFAYEAISWSVAAGLISGDQGNINPQGNASRAVCATIIIRFLDNVLEVSYE